MSAYVISVLAIMGINVMLAVSLNMISGFYKPDAGSIRLEGRDITHLRPANQ